MPVFAGVERMSDHNLAADQSVGYSLADLRCLQYQPGTIFISHNELAALAGSGTHCLIIPVASASGDDGEPDASKPQQSDTEACASVRSSGRALHAVAIGAGIGVSVGVAIASGMALMVGKTGLDIAAIVQQALIYVT